MQLDIKERFEMKVDNFIEDIINILHNLGLMILIGFGIYLTKSPWVLLALFFCKSCDSEEI